MRGSELLSKATTWFARETGTIPTGLFREGSPGRLRGRDDVSRASGLPQAASTRVGSGSRRDRAERDAAVLEQLQRFYQAFRWPLRGAAALEGLAGGSRPLRGAEAGRPTDAGGEPHRREPSARQGCQYTALAFGRRREEGIRPSRGSVGDAYDNALAESFFATLECRRRFRTQAEARVAIFRCI